MARQYVMTGKKKYRDAYYQILAIRNGLAPRPLNYHALYWSFAVDSKEPQPVGPPQSLAKLMEHHVFTLKEYALFTQTERESNALTRLEIKAMNMADGKYEDKQGHYTMLV